MKFTINKNDILDILSKVQGICGRKSNLAITSNILIKAGESGISLAATDLETGFEGRYPAMVESDGIMAINARKFFEIVRDFPSADILVNEVENRWIEIGSKGIEYHIVGMNPEDFPEIPKIADVEFFEVDSIDIKKAIEKMLVIGAAGDEKRAHILGVNLERMEEGEAKLIRMASTDGRRLSKVDYLCEDNMDLPMGNNVIVPKKGLSEINRFLAPEGTVQIGIKDNHFILQKENETLIIGLLEGEFPEYGDILAKDEERNIEVDRHLFIMMLKRMSILSSDDYRSVVFNFSDGRLLVTATNPDIGESKEDMAIAFAKDPVEVAFNPKYFIDTLNSIEDEKVVLNITDGETPCLVEGAIDKSFLSVIMPMKI